MNSPLRVLIFLLAWSFGAFVAASPGAGITDTPFVQEYHEAFPIGREDGCNDVRAIAVDGTGSVWAGTRTGLYRLDSSTKQWIELIDKENAGPVYDIVVDRTGIVWIGAWNGMYRSTPNGLLRLMQIESPIAALCVTENEIIGLGSAGIWSVTDDTCTYKEMPYSKQFRAALAAKSGGLWIATGMGLYHHTDTEYKLYQTESELLGPDLAACGSAGLEASLFIRTTNAFATSLSLRVCPAFLYDVWSRGPTATCGSVRIVVLQDTMDGTGRSATANAGFSATMCVTLHLIHREQPGLRQIRASVRLNANR